MTYYEDGNIYGPNLARLRSRMDGFKGKIKNLMTVKTIDPLIYQCTGGWTSSLGSLVLLLPTSQIEFLYISEQSYRGRLLCRDMEFQIP